jgi:hypothetical protein
MTTAVMDLKAVTTVIWDTLDVMFPKVRFAGVTVKPDTSFYGDPILWIDAYYDGPDDALSGRAMNMAVGEARQRLASIGCDDFPIFSYVSTQEKKPPRAARRLP